MSMKMTVSWIAALSLAVGQPFSLCAGEESWQSDFKRPSSGFVPLDVVAPQAPQAPQAQDPSSRPPEDSLRAGPSPSPRLSEDFLRDGPSRSLSADNLFNGGIKWTPGISAGSTSWAGPGGTTISEQHLLNGDVIKGQTWRREDGSVVSSSERYNDQGRLLSRTWQFVDASGEEGQGQTSFFDEKGNLTGSAATTFHEDQDGSVETTYVNYDSQGNITGSGIETERLPAPGDPNALPVRTTDRFDPDGHLTSRTTEFVGPGADALGMVTEFFNAQGQVTGSVERVRDTDTRTETLIERDAGGNELRRQDRLWEKAEDGGEKLTITTSQPGGSRSVLTVTGTGPWPSQTSHPVSAVLELVQETAGGGQVTTHQNFEYKDGAWQAVDASGNVQAGVPIPEILNALTSNLVP